MKRLALILALVASSAYGQAVIQGDPKTSEMTFNNSGTAAAPTIWTSGVTTARETVGLTGANKYATLPAANTFPSGKVILYIDGVTTENFGRVFRPIVGNSLNGINGVANPGTAADVLPFIAGGLNGISTQRFETDGVSAWRMLDSGYRVGSIWDALDKTKAATFNLFPNTTGNTRVIRVPDADSTIVVPELGADASLDDIVQIGIGLDQVVTGVNDDGTLELHRIASELPDTTGHAGDVLTVNSSLVPEWSDPPASEYVTLIGTGSPVAGVVPIPWAVKPGVARQNAFVSLSQTPNRLSITGAEPGMHFTVYVRQTTGTQALLPPTDSFTTGAVPGSIPSPTPAAGQLDVIEGDYVAHSNVPTYAFYQTASALASPTPIPGTACDQLFNSTTDRGATTGIVLLTGDQSNRQYMSNTFVAAEAKLICRVDLNLMRTLNPTTTMQVGIYNDAARLTVNDANVSNPGGVGTITSATAVGGTGWAATDVGHEVTGTGNTGHVYVGTFTAGTPPTITLSSSKSSPVGVAATTTGTGMTVSVRGVPASGDPIGGITGGASGNGGWSTVVPSSSIPNFLNAAAGTPNADVNATRFENITMGTTLVVGNTYHVVLRTNGTISSSDYVNWLYNSSSTGLAGYRINRSSNATTWATLQNSNKARWTAYHVLP